MVARPEQDIHKAVVQHLRQRAMPGLVWWHTPNGALLGGKRNRKGIAIQGSIMKGLGVRAGVADLMLIHKGRAYALELKAPNGRPTEHQQEFMADFNAAGGYGCICYDLDRAIHVLECWGLLRGITSYPVPSPAIAAE